MDTFVSAASRCWNAEYLAVAKYLRGEQRTDETDAQWVLFQAHKEWTGSGVYGAPGVNVRAIVCKAAERVASSDTDTPLETLESVSEFLSFGADEFRHYVQLSKAYALLKPGSPLDLKQAEKLAEGKALTALRHDMRSSSKLGELAVDLSEGGGLAMYFALRDYYREFPAVTPAARAMKSVGEVTLDDEIGHFQHRLGRAVAMGLPNGDHHVVAKLLFEICKAKANERNAQFGYPLTAAELESLCADEAGGRRFLTTQLKDCLHAKG